MILHVTLMGDTLLSKSSVTLLSPTDYKHSGGIEREIEANRVYDARSLARA